MNIQKVLKTKYSEFKFKIRLVNTNDKYHKTF